MMRKETAHLEILQVAFGTLLCQEVDCARGGPASKLPGGSDGWRPRSFLMIDLAELACALVPCPPGAANQNQRQLPRLCRHPSEAPSPR